MPRHALAEAPPRDPKHPGRALSSPAPAPAPAKLRAIYNYGNGRRTGHGASAQYSQPAKVQVTKHSSQVVPPPRTGILQAKVDSAAMQQQYLGIDVHAMPAASPRSSSSGSGSPPRSPHAYERQLNTKGAGAPLLTPTIDQELKRHRAAFLQFSKFIASQDPEQVDITMAQAALLKSFSKIRNEEILAGGALLASHPPLASLPFPPPSPSSVLLSSLSPSTSRTGPQSSSLAATGGPVPASTSLLSSSPSSASGAGHGSGSTVVVAAAAAAGAGLAPQSENLLLLPPSSPSHVVALSSRQRLAVLRQHRSLILAQLERSLDQAQVQEELEAVDLQIERAKFTIALHEMHVLIPPPEEDPTAKYMSLAFNLGDRAKVIPGLRGSSGVLDRQNIFVYSLDLASYDAHTLSRILLFVRDVAPSDQAFCWLALRIRSTDEWFVEASRNTLEHDELIKAFTKLVLTQTKTSPHLLPLWAPILLFFSPRLVWWSLDDAFDRQLVPTMQHLLVTGLPYTFPTSRSLAFPLTISDAQYPDYALALSENAAQLEEIKDMLVNGILDSLQNVTEATSAANGSSGTSLAHVAAAHRLNGSGSGTRSSSDLHHDNGDLTAPPPPPMHDDVVLDYFVPHEWESFIVDFVDKLMRQAMSNGPLQGLIPFDVFYQLEKSLQPDDAQVAHHHMLFTASNEALSALYPALIPDPLDEPWLEGIKVAVRRQRLPPSDPAVVAKSVADWLLRFDRLDRVPALDSNPEARWRSGTVVVDRWMLVECADAKQNEARPEFAQRLDAALCASAAERFLEFMVANVATELEFIDEQS